MASPPDPSLAWLLSPVSVTDFERDVLHKQPRVIRATPVKARASSLFSLETLCVRAQAQPPLLMEVDLCASRVLGGVRERVDARGHMTAAKLQELWGAGYTLQCHQPQRFSLPLWELMADMEARLGCLVGANVYLTPPGCTGLKAHWDDVDVYVLQTVGTKHWRIYPEANNVTARPLGFRPRMHSPDLDSSSLGAHTDIVLSPGDVLYLPRGTPHEATAAPSGGKGGCGTGGSVHVTFSTAQCWDAGDLAAHALRWLTDGATLGGGASDVDAAARCALALRAPLPARAVYCGAGARAAPSSRDLAAAAAAALRAAADALDACPAAIDGAVHGLAQDFFEHRLPPPPSKGATYAQAATAATAAGPPQLLPPQARGPAPASLEDTIAPLCAVEGYARVVLGDDPSECQVMWCAGNDRVAHMMSEEALERQRGEDEQQRADDEDGTEEEDDEGTEEDEDDESDDDEFDKGIHFPASCAPALRAILTSPSDPSAPGVRIRDLPELGSKKLQLQFAMTLWEVGLVRCSSSAGMSARQPAPAGAAAGSRSGGGGGKSGGSAPAGPKKTDGVVMVSLADIVRMQQEEVDKKAAAAGGRPAADVAAGRRSNAGGGAGSGAAGLKRKR